MGSNSSLRVGGWQMTPITPTREVGVECGNCGGNVYMVTCNHFRASGHEWVIVGICMICRAVNWTNDGCPDCDGL